MRLNNFGIGGSIFTKLFQTTFREAGVIMCVQFLEGLLKFGRAIKTSTYRRDLWQLSTLIANISGMDLHVEHLEKNLINHNPFHVGRKKLGELWPTNQKVLEVHTEPPKWTFFGRLHFGHYGALHPQIFTHARDWATSSGCKDTPIRPEVIGTNALNFRPNFKFSRSKDFGGHPSPFGCALSRFGQSLARTKLWGGSTP